MIPLVLLWRPLKVQLVRDLESNVPDETFPEPETYVSQFPPGKLGTFLNF